MTCSSDRLDVMRGGAKIQVKRDELTVGDSTPLIPGFVYEVVTCEDSDLSDTDLRVVRLQEGDPRWVLFDGYSEAR
jgi:hypothetical protein